jgi:TANFOR domain-containing protein
MLNTLRSLCILILVAASLSAWAQPLRISVNLLNPYPNKISDFQSNPNQLIISITNTSQVAFDVQLLGSISGDNNVRVYTSGNYRSRRPVTVAPFSVTTVSAADVSELFNVNTLVFAGTTREEAIRMNGLPEGSYQICVQAIDFVSRAPLSAEEPFGCSNLFMISNLEPPVIIKPFADEELRVQSPQNIVFNWSLPPGAPPSLQYEVRLVEVPPGRNAFDVMRSSRQSFFERIVTGAPTMLYGPAEPPLVPGRRYAMMVTAIDPFQNLVFRNGGRSEVVLFTYGAADGADGSSMVGVAAEPSGSGIPQSVITGKIEWYFKASEEKMSPFSGTAKIQFIESPVLTHAILDPTSGPKYNAPISAAASGKITTVNFKTLETTSQAPSQSVISSPFAGISSPVVAVSGAGFTSAITSSASQASANPIGIVDFGSLPHPLQQVKVNVYAVGLSGTKSLLGSSMTGSEGEFEIPFVNPAFYNPELGNKLSIEIDHPDFHMQKTSIALPRPDSVGKIDLGTLKAVARSFRLKPKVLNDDGAEVKDAVVEIFRDRTYYQTEPNHLDEGQRTGQDQIINGRNCIKVGSVRSGQTVGQLFYSDSWMDQYILRVAHAELQPMTTTLKVVAEGNVREEILTVEKEFTCSPKHPSLKGRVSKRLEPIVHVLGATVTLHINDDSKIAEGWSTVESYGKEYLAKAMGAAQPPGKITTTSPRPTSAVSNKLNILAPFSSATPISYVGASPTSTGAAKVLSENVSTITDSAGNYSFSNLPVSDKVLKISVRIPGSDQVYYDSILVSARGKDYEKDILLSMTVFTIVGVVKDEEGKPIPQPVLTWASGGSGMEGDGEGRFAISNTSGNDTLIVKKLGYEVKRIPVSLKEPPKNNGKKSDMAGSILSPGQWMESVSVIPSLSSGSSPFTAAGLGYVTQVKLPSSGSDATKKNSAIVTTNPLQVALAPLFTALIVGDDQPVAPVDLGVITLKKKIGRIKVVVTNEGDGSKIEGALITVVDSPISGETNSSGEWYSEVPGGDIVVEARGTATSGHVPERKQILTDDTEVTTIEFLLKRGTTVTGTVRAGTKTIESAQIRVDGKEYLKTQTNSTGQYTLVVPSGDYTLKATRTGYIGDEKQQLFSGTSATIDFSLGEAGFDISKILGFEVEIESMTGSGTTRTLDGAIVNLPSNPLFMAKSGSKLTFDGLTVDIAGGVPVPRNGHITLSQTSLDVLAFGYLPVKIKNDDKPLQIKQVLGNKDAGQLTGFAEIDYGKFIPIPLGLIFPDDTKHTLSSKDATSAELVIMQTGSPVAAALNLSLRFSKPEVELYGFKATLNPAACSVGSDGLQLGGELNLSGVPLLDKTTLPIDQLLIGKDGSIKKVSVALEVDKAIDLSVWKATLLSVHINENGLKLSGNTKVTIPSSAEAKIGFDNLSVTRSSIFGGNFSFPDEGIDIFKLVKMKTGTRPITFGKIGNSSVYYIGGSGDFKLPSFIDKTLSVEFFQIQTDGNFEARVAANFNVAFLGLADLTIRSLGFRTIGTPGIDVKGDFNFNAIPFFKASAGGIHYESNGSVSVEELGLGFDLVGVAKMSARAKFIERSDRKGFEGEGHVKIKSTPLDLGLGFRYYKLSGGIEVGGLIRAGITIPIGAVTLSEIEGEFNLNTADKKWMGRIGGSLSIGGLNAAVAVKPLTITVENGPVFKLMGGLSVIGQNIAKAEGILDFPQSYFALNFVQDLNFLPQLVTASGGGIMVVSTAKDNTYWMMGVRYEASMLGDLVKGNANITAGWGLNIDAHPEHSDYTGYINRDYTDGGVLKGIHVATAAGINFDTGDRVFADVAVGRAWYKNYGAVNMDMGFGRGRYGFRVAAGWSVGAYLKISDVDVAGLDAGIEGELQGFYDYGGNYLSFDGLLRARLIAWIGSCSAECQNKICWGGCFNACAIGCEVCPIPVGGKLCLRPGVRAGYNSVDGFSMNIDF